MTGGLSLDAEIAKEGVSGRDSSLSVDNKGLVIIY
jgi:hypothetical protein